MPSTKWTGIGARTLRDAADRAHRRVEPLPRLPFLVAFAMAVMVLVVALEFRPASEKATVEVDEHSQAPPGMEYDSGFSEVEVAFEIVEYGISKVTVDDMERIVVGAVVRNPYDMDLNAGALSLTVGSEPEELMRIEDFFLGVIPPETSVSVGFIASGGGGIPVEALRLEALEPSYIYSNPEGILPRAVLPEVTVLATEPLLSPDGYRLRYRVDALETTDVRISVLFRDDEGRLLGGVPAGASPFSRFHDEWTSYRFPVTAGETFHHVDVPLTWIPEGADPDRFEVGTGG